MFPLAQVAEQFESVPHYAPPEMPLGLWLFGGVFSLVSMAYTAFAIWMLVHCIRFEPDKGTWLFLMLFFWFPVPILYFLVRYLPSRDYRAPRFLRRWTRGRELARLEAAVRQIGNPHHYIQWGDALRDVGAYDRAAEAYAEALKKEPTNNQAQWGAALVAIQHQDYAAAKPLLEHVLERDPQYKFGDVSLQYARTLYKLGERDAARLQLEKHIRRWRHPEALYLLATIYQEQGDRVAARDQLQAMLLDINSSPKPIARQYGVWKSRARKMLRNLPA